LLTPLSSFHINFTTQTTGNIWPPLCRNSVIDKKKKVSGKLGKWLIRGGRERREGTGRY
jgi:hypothetical protein